MCETSILFFCFVFRLLSRCSEDGFPRVGPPPALSALLLSHGASRRAVK